MDELAERLPVSLTAVRVVLVAFVAAWIFGPDELRSAVPIWLPFLIVLGLEVAFLVSALRGDTRERPDRAPQPLDRELYGYEAEGDELVLVRDGKAMPFPRRFNIKEESTRLLTQMKPLFETLPYNMTYYNHRMYSLSPHDVGREWKIDEADVRAVFYLVPNHDGETRIEECPKYLMVNRVMPMSFLSEKDDHMKISHLCRMIDDAECHTIYIGGLEGAVSGLQERLSVI